MSAAPRHRARVGARSLQFRTAHILFQRPHLFGQLCAFLFQLADGGDRRFAALLLGCGGQGLARGGQQLFKFRKSCLFALPLNFRTGPSSRPIPVLFSDRVRHSFSMPPSILPALTIP